MTAFESDYQAAIHGIRGALTEVLASVGADAHNPADIAERLDIHKLLAWRLSKIVTMANSATPLRQLPGATGIKILDKAFAAAHAPAQRVQAFHDAIASYRRMIERHAGDDAMLEVMLASRQDDPAFADQAIAMRKEAFRGAAAVWGGHARMQLAMNVVAPTRGSDELIDLGHLGGIVDFCRLRESAFWPVHTRLLSTDEGTDMEAGEVARPRSSMVEQFCSTPLPEFDELRNGQQTTMTLKPGIVGRTGLITWMMDRVVPGLVSRYRDAENTLAQHSLVVRTPVELLKCDLLIHRDLPFELPPEAHLYGDVAGAHAHILALPNDQLELSISERVDFLGSQPPVVSTPHVSGATEMAEYLCGQIGRRLDEFTGYRFSMHYPPIPTVLFLSHPLLTR